jgi:hypothetical protein
MKVAILSRFDPIGPSSGNLSALDRVYRTRRPHGLKKTWFVLGIVASMAGLVASDYAEQAHMVSSASGGTVPLRVRT